MSRTSSCAVVSVRATVATDRPDRSTVMRSAISSISSMRWEMKMTVPAWAVSRRTMAKRRSRVATSSADVDSSRMRIRGSRTSARAMPQTCRMLSGSVSTGASSGGASPVSSVSTAAARSRLTSSDTLRRKSPSTPIQTFSSTVCGPTTSTSWNTGTTPASSVARGDFTWSRRRPAISIVPLSGRCTPARILTSVLLPEPFSPTTAWTSPARASNVHSRSACVRPNAFARPSTARTTSPAPAASAAGTDGSSEVAITR